MRVAFKQIKEINEKTYIVPSAEEYNNSIIRHPASLETGDAIQRTINTITNISDDSTSIYNVYVTAYSTAEYLGTKHTLIVTRASGTTSIKLENVDVNASTGGTGLKAANVVCSVSSNNIAIKIKGVTATTIMWNCQYEKII